MVGLTETADPGDGIGDGVIEGAVVVVELTVGLTAAIDEAVAALACVAWLATPSR
jgi:hypothetical protein